MNPSCPICFDLFNGEDIVSTPCGHVFHSHCLLRWIENAKNCPECRRKITRRNIKKLFFYTTTNNTVNNDLALAQKKIKDLHEHAASTYQLYFTKILALQAQLDESKLQIGELKNEVKTLIKINSSLETEFSQLENFTTLLRCSQQEGSDVLHQQSVLLAKRTGGRAAKNILDICYILKDVLNEETDENEGGHANLACPIATTSNNRKKVAPTFIDLKGPELTPPLIDLSEEEMPAMKKLQLETTPGFSSTNPVSSPFPNRIFPPFKKELDTDKTVSRSGGHERVMGVRAQKHSKAKPY